jgi:hypothetical protein
MDNLNDSVGGANLNSNQRYFSFVQDRFCCQNKAISIAEKNGKLDLPTGIYFSADFTISAWINLKSRIKETHFGNFILSAGTELRKNYVIFYVRNSFLGIRVESSSLESSSVIQLNQWYHVAVTLQDTSASLYVNGVLVNAGPCTKPPNVTRIKNCIGCAGGIVVDDLKIYQDALTANDLLNDYNVGLYNSTLFNSCTTSEAILSIIFIITTITIIIIIFLVSLVTIIIISKLLFNLMPNII